MTKQTLTPRKRGLRPFGKIIMPSILFLSLCMLSLSNKASAQESISVSSLQKDAAASWHPLKQVGAVTISYQYIECGPVEYIFLKVENPTNSKVTVSWKYQYFNEQVPLEASPDDANVALTVNANSTLSGSCFAAGMEKLAVFVKESGHALRTTLIKLNDLSISSVH